MTDHRNSIWEVAPGRVDPVQPCLEKKLAPCDIDRLTITDLGDGTSLSCTKRLREGGVEPGTPEWIRPSLSAYDLVFERIVDYDTGFGDPVEHPLELKISRAHHGSCSVSAHPAVVTYPLSGKPRNRDEGAHWVMTPPGVIKLATYSARAAGARGGFLAAYWNMRYEKIREVAILAIGCGVRSDELAPLGALNALVRLYAREQWELSFELPAMRSYEWKHEVSVAPIGNVVSRTDSRTTSHSGKVQSETISTSEQQGEYGSTNVFNATETVGRRDEQGVFVQISASGGRRLVDGQAGVGAAEGFVTAKIAGSVEGAGVLGLPATFGAAMTFDSGKGAHQEFTVEYKLPVKVKLSCNDQEVSLSGIVESILNVRSIVRGTIQAIKDLKELKPSVGFDLSAGISFMEGAISGSWGYQACTQTGDRYRAVRVYKSISFGLKVFAIDASLMFGVECKVQGCFGSPFMEFTVKIEGTVKGGVDFAGTFTDKDLSAKENKENAQVLKAMVVPQLEACFRAQLLGFFVVDLGVDVVGGYTFDGTVLLVDGPRIDYEIRSKDVSVQYWMITKHGKRRPTDRLVLMEGKPLTAGTWPDRGTEVAEATAQ